MIQAPSSSLSDHQQIIASFERLRASHWGRWGAEDTSGTLNHVTAATRIAAAAEIRTGLSVSCSRPIAPGECELSKFGPPTRELRRGPEDPPDEPGKPPFVMETWSFTFHGRTISHWDALSHCSYQGLMYNGVPAAGAVTPQGCATSLSVEAAAAGGGLFVRGVLLDLAKEGAWLEPGVAVTPTDLEAAEISAGLRVQAGDAVLVRTGHARAMREAVGGFSSGRGQPACHYSCAEWLAARGAAILGSDSANDVFPAPCPTMCNPLHVLLLVGMGMPLLDNLELEELSVCCRSLGRWSFALSVCPLKLAGGTGSPVNAMALF